MGRLLRLCLLVVVAAATFAPVVAYAHRNPCHRFHSCPSHDGSYVCGDLGDDSQCPEGSTTRARARRTATAAAAGTRLARSGAPIVAFLVGGTLILAIGAGAAAGVRFLPAKRS